MAQPTSGDDYYANIGPSTTQSSGGTEKKKIKIVAKKAAPATPPVEKIEPQPEPEYNTTQAVLENEEPQPHIPRTVKLPEGGQLDLGAKFTHRPQVVFHTHQARTVLPGSARPAGNTSAGGNRPSFSRPNGAPQRPGGSGQFQRPGQSRPGQPAKGGGNFRKPDAPKKNFKTTKRGAKHKLTFLSPENKEDLDKFRRAKGLVGEKQEKNIDDIKQTLVDRSGQEVEIGDFLTVKEFSDKIGIPLARIIGELMKNGIMVNINSQIDFDTCFLIAESFDIKVKKIHSTDSSITDLMDGNIEALLASDDAGEKTTRPPIISVMGHVDHGKTSILDSIRKTDVAAGEAGGITQKIGAYQVTKNGRQMTFLDTPGHEAFALMRSRGAKLTDIIILVVAADEGLKPQTIESINLAKEANVPVVVAINKIDKPGADPEMVKRALSEHELIPEDWGGDTICVPCSAKTGLGIDTLLDMVLLVADMKQFKSHPTRPGVGTVIESHLDPGQGVIANILVNAGVFNRGDAVFCGSACGKIRTMKDSFGKNVSEATSSMPVQITGLDEVPEGGQIIQVFPTLEAAREKTQAFKLASSSKSVNKFENASLMNLMGRLKTGTLQHLKVVLKADSNGSLEALKASLQKITAKDVAVKIIHAGIGAVNESDVLMAGTSAALLVAFNVPMGTNATDTLSKSKIEVIADKVIYRIIEKVESIATGMIDIKYDQVLVGEGKALKIFYTGEKMQIVGLSVVSGNIQKGAQLKIIRNDRVSGTGKVESLKEGVYEVNQVEEGKECGIQYKGEVRVVPEDKLEFYMT
ncbi:translation initiation factor IF-2, partial [Candidatus Gracilibacteria bacterium]|nr:translation initiation factor IF-2 [Candidatus Gracilibacteria bacterium]